MRKNTALNNFTGGEWTPFLDGRADLQKYDSACISMKNFRPLPWGGVTFRPGTEFIGLAKFPGSKCRLLPFNYSTNLSFVIEMGVNYLRFWNSNGTPVSVSTAPTWVSGQYYDFGNYTKDPTNGLLYMALNSLSSSTQPHADVANWVQQSILEIPTSVNLLTAGQIFGIQYKQINAQMRLTHTAFAPMTLTYSGGTLQTAWALQVTSFKYPVLLDQNALQSLTLAAGSTTAGAATTLTATAPAWVTGTYYPPNVAASNGGHIYESTAQFTSSATFAQDLANGLWALADPFNANHVGSYWELQHLRPSSSALVDMNNQTVGVTVYSSIVQMEGDWTFTTSQFWYGEVQVQRSIDGGATFTTIRDFTAKSDQNYATSGTETAPNIGFPAVQYRIAYTMAGTPFSAGVWVGSAPTQYSYAQAALESQDAYIAGLFVVTGFTSGLQVAVKVVIAPQATTATYLWSEGAFSNYRGFPQAIAFYEQRLLYSGTAFQPNTVWGSVTGDFDNFQYSDNDDGALAFQPAVTQQNQTAWMASLLRVHVGTSGEEIIMASGNLDEALTPSNVTMRAQSYYGSVAIQPMLLQNSILFVERNGLRVREMRELSPYIVPTDFIAPDLTLMAEHITQPGIVEMDFGRLPDPLAYFIRSDGVMPVMTYNREQNINAWAQYVTQGNYESVACIYGTPADEVWVSVSRTLGGTPVRTIEVFTTDPAEYPSLTANMMLDCGTQVVPGAGATSIPGLTYLANQTVTAVIDGAEYVNLTVAANGTLTFPPNVTTSTAFSIVNVGIPYVGYLTPMKPVMQDQEGSSQGRKIRISEIVLRVRNSVSVEWAGKPNPAASDYRPLKFRSPGDTTGSMTPLSGGSANPNGVSDYPLPQPWPDGNSFSGQINLRQSHPFPLTILGIFTKFDTL